MSKKTKTLILTGSALIIIIMIALAWAKWRGQEEVPSDQAVVSNELFPSGELLPGGDIFTSNTASSSPLAEEGTVSDATGRFYRVSARPIGGLALVGQATSSALIYAEKITGHLYRLQPGAAAERISNTTIPKVYSLAAGQSGTSTELIISHLREGRLQTIAVSLDIRPTLAGDDFLSLPESDLPTLATRAWPAEILSLAVSPDHSQVFWLEPSGNQSVAYLAQLDGSNKQTLFRSPYQEWQASWVSPTVIALQSRSSELANGSLYLWDLRSKELEPVITGVPGLSTLVNPDLNRVLYSGLGEQGLVFGIYDRSKKFFSRLNMRTWTEKCVWSRAGLTAYCAVPAGLPSGYRYPDDWYRGEVRLNDNIWKIDTVTDQNEIIFSPTTSNLDINLDADKLLLDPEEKTLYINNRYDQRLWALDISGSF